MDFVDDDSPAPSSPVDTRIKDGKLWARGMSTLSPDEEAELRQYFASRWDGADPFIPSYISASLLEKLVTRGIAEGNNLTTYGQTVIPNLSPPDLALPSTV